MPLGLDFEFSKVLKNTANNFKKYLVEGDIPLEEYWDSKDSRHKDRPINSFYKAVKLVHNITLQRILVGGFADLNPEASSGCVFFPSRNGRYSLCSIAFSLSMTLAGIVFTIVGGTSELLQSLSHFLFTHIILKILLIPLLIPLLFFSNISTASNRAVNCLNSLDKFAVNVIKVLMYTLITPVLLLGGISALVILSLMLASKVVVWLAALLITPLVWLADKIFSAAKNEVVSDTQSVDEAQNGRATKTIVKEEVKLSPETQSVAEIAVASDLSAEEQVKVSTLVDSKEIDGLQNGIESETTLEKAKGRAMPDDSEGIAESQTVSRTLTLGVGNPKSFICQERLAREFLYC